MARLGSVLGIAAALLIACGSLAPTPAVLPTFVASAAPSVPEANQAYPTAAASDGSASQTVGGFTVELQKAWRDGKQLYADVCFSLPDNWTIWVAHVDYAGQTVTEFSSSLLNRQEAAGGSPARRCDELDFYVPPDADLSAAQLSIESLGAYPSNDELCSVYLPKIQQALSDRGIAISLSCTDANGSTGLQITSKPADMTQEQAEQLVYSDEFYTVKGPWNFPLRFAP
jgi:hypothetical protein